MRPIDSIFRIALIGVYALVLWKGIEFSRFALVKEHIDGVILSSSRQDKVRISTEMEELERVLTYWQNIAGVQSDAVLASVGIKRVLNPTNFRNLEPEAMTI